MQAEILKQEPGRYALVKSGDRYFASVACGSSARYVLNVPISQEQARRVIGDPVLLDQLVGSIEMAPTRYLGQHVPLNDDQDRED